MHVLPRRPPQWPAGGSLASLFVVGPNIIVEPFGRRAKHFCRSDFSVSWRFKLSLQLSLYGTFWRSIYPTYNSDDTKARQKPASTSFLLQFTYKFNEFASVVESEARRDGRSGWRTFCRNNQHLLSSLLSLGPHIIVEPFCRRAKYYCRASWSYNQILLSSLLSSRPNITVVIIVAKAKYYCRHYRR